MYRSGKSVLSATAGSAGIPGVRIRQGGCGLTKRRRWPPSPSVTGKARLNGRRWYRPRPTMTCRVPNKSAAQTRVCTPRQSLSPDLPSNNSRVAKGGGLKIGSQNRTPAAPRIRQNGPRQASTSARQSADLRVCVELRGFEPLTPSMRKRVPSWHSVA